MKHPGYYLCVFYEDEPRVPVAHPVTAGMVEVLGEWGAVVELWRRLRALERLNESDVWFGVLTLEQLEAAA